MVADERAELANYATKAEGILPINTFAIQKSQVSSTDPRVF